MLSVCVKASFRCRKSWLTCYYERCTRITLNNVLCPMCYGASLSVEISDIKYISQVLVKLISSCPASGLGTIGILGLSGVADLISWFGGANMDGTLGYALGYEVMVWIIWRSGGLLNLLWCAEVEETIFEETMFNSLESGMAKPLDCNDCKKIYVWKKILQRK